MRRAASMLPARPSASMMAYLVQSRCNSFRATDASRICSTASCTSDEPGARALADRAGTPSSTDAAPHSTARRAGPASCGLGSARSAAGCGLGSASSAQDRPRRTAAIGAELSFT
jgi:hypothetical protein